MPLEELRHRRAGHVCPGDRRSAHPLIVAVSAGVVVTGGAVEVRGRVGGVRTEHGSSRDGA